MKKQLLVFLTMIVCLSVLIGCDNRPDQQKPDAAAESPTGTSVGVFDCYYGLATVKGLEVYVWKTGESTYRCGVASGTNRNKTPDEIAAFPPATIEEMKTILASYAISEENIIVIPVINPQCHYPWVLDDTELQTLRELFGVETVVDTMQVYAAEYKGYYDSISTDIDNDGIEETCTLGYGQTSGLFTFTFTASVDDVLKYSNVYCTEWYALSFAERDGKIYVQGITQGIAPETHLFSISVADGNIVLSENGEQLASFFPRQEPSP